MNYLLYTDYTAALQDADINRLALTDPAIAAPAEQLAMAEIRRELGAFDLRTALEPWQAYDAGISYTAGTRLILEGSTLYYAVQDVPPGSDPTDTSYWAPGDNRPPELVEAVLRLTLFHLVGRLGIGTMPAYVADRARDVRMWLQGQARGLAPSLLPRLDEKPPFQFGSTTPRMDGRAIW